MRHLSYLRVGRKAAVWRVAAPVLAALLLVFGGDRTTTIPGESFIGAPIGPATPAASPVAPSWEFGTVPNAYSMSLTADAGTGRQPVTASWTYIDGLPGLNAQIDSWLSGHPGCPDSPRRRALPPRDGTEHATVPGPWPGNHADSTAGPGLRNSHAFPGCRGPLDRGNDLVSPNGVGEVRHGVSPVLEVCREGTAPAFVDSGS
jgi:hypothetical protein